MYSDSFDINLRQQCYIVPLVKEDCACFELLFGNELQSLIELLQVSGTSYWLLRLKLSRVELYFHFVCKAGGNFVI